jgi:dihydroneopterin aldolase
MSDSVTVAVTGLECFGYHGVFPEERTNGQRFVVDLEMTLIETSATQTDHLADTVDYEAIAEAVAGIMEGPPVSLLEHLAALAADRVMAEPRALEVLVTVRKPEVVLARAGASAPIGRARWRGGADAGLSTTSAAVSLHKRPRSRPWAPPASAWKGSAPSTRPRRATSRTSRRF